MFMDGFLIEMKKIVYLLMWKIIGSFFFFLLDLYGLEILLILQKNPFIIFVPIYYEDNYDIYIIWLL